MPTSQQPKRRFNFLLSILLRDGDKLLAAINDPVHTVKIKARLGESIASDVNNKLVAVRDALNLRAAKTGEAGELTKDQKFALHEMERLTAGARRTASLAFRGQKVVRHDEFQVGVNEPQGLDSELLRAGIIASSCAKHAVELGKQGWIAADTASLHAAIATLSGTDQEHEDAIIDRMELTGDATRAANALYDELLRVQNGARLQWPLPPAGVEIASGILSARNKFLLDTFPPRDRSQPDAGATPAPAPTPAPPAP
jgi:hypothetical protein